jgi:site-specific recombinase XerD
MNNNRYLSKHIRSFFEDYLVCRRKMSDCTIRSYRDAVKLFVQFVASHRRKSAANLLITDVNDSIINDFLIYLEKNRGNSIQTRNHRLAILRSLFSYVSLQEPLFLEYCRQVLNFPIKRRTELPEIHYLEKEEMDLLFKAIDTRTALGRRDYAILRFMYNTGARVSETADTRISRLYFEAPAKVEILGKGSKWRTCPLWKTTAEILRNLIDEQIKVREPDTHIFLNRSGKPLSRFGIYGIIAKYKERASNSRPSLSRKILTPHTIRHTTAMHLLQSGVDINVIRSWLGHAQLETTHRYVEIDLAMKAKALKVCEPKNETVPFAEWRSNPDIVSWLEAL